jgi:hypothetical protein
MALLPLGPPRREIEPLRHVMPGPLSHDNHMRRLALTREADDRYITTGVPHATNLSHTSVIPQLRSG